MRWVVAALLSVSAVGAENPASETLELTSDKGDAVLLRKEIWPVALRCYVYQPYKTGTRGAFVLSVRALATDALPKNAWVIFDDLTAYPAVYRRQGIDMRADWDDRTLGQQFSVKAAPDGAGYYFNWTMADEEGRMSVTRTLTCIKPPAAE